MRCFACGGTSFVDQTVIWHDLAIAWELTQPERAYIDRQQGTHCTECGSNLRSCALAGALLVALDGPATLNTFVETASAQSIDLLEINQAGSLSPFLTRLTGHRLANYPDVDMQEMPYDSNSFDVVVHSDTLEHVPNLTRALSECLRILRPGGVLCFTVPIIVGRMTRDCSGRIPSFHGSSVQTGEDFRVQTEFGADVWAFVMEVGFSMVTLSTIEFPAALAITARKGGPTFGTSSESATLRLLRRDYEAMQNSRSWRITHGLRVARTMLRRLRAGLSKSSSLERTKV